MVVLPFVKAKNDVIDLPTPIENQLIVRTAQGLGSGLGRAGVLGLAYSTTMPTTSPLPRATILTKKQAKARGWSGWKDSKTTYRPSHPLAQNKWMSKTTRRKQWGGQSERPSASRKLAKGSLRAGSGSAIVLGRALPIIAYGYVGYSLYTKQYPEPGLKSEDPWGATEIAYGLSDNLKQQHQTIMNYSTTALGVGYSVSRTVAGMAITSAVLGGLLPDMVL